MGQKYVPKLKLYDEFGLFVKNCFRCLPQDAFELKDITARWFIIGRDRLDKELNLEKLLRTLRNIKILTLSDKERKAKLALNELNTIQVDSDDCEEA